MLTAILLRFTFIVSELEADMVFTVVGYTLPE